MTKKKGFQVKEKRKEEHSDCRGGKSIDSGWKMGDGGKVKLVAWQSNTNGKKPGEESRGGTVERKAEEGGGDLI